MKRITIVDIAKMAGVSHPVVSIVLNNAPDAARISREKRELIRKIADELHFVPNLAARQLSGGRSRMIGVITNIYLSERHAGLQSIVTMELYARGYDVLCLPGPRIGNDEDSRFVMDRFRMHNVEGIISLASPLRTRKIAERCEIPYVELGESAENESLSDFSFDRFLGGKYAAQHLIREHDRKKICFLSALPFHSNGNALRKFYGMKQAMEEAGVPCSESAFADISAMTGSEIVEHIRREKINGVFACNDICALNFMRAAVKAGIRIPDDVAVIGYDGNILCESALISLATIRQPRWLIAKYGIDKLVNRIEKNIPANDPAQFIPPIFLPGESCGCHPAAADHISAEDALYLRDLKGDGETVNAVFAKSRNYWKKDNKGYPQNNQKGVQ